MKPRAAELFQAAREMGAQVEESAPGGLPAGVSGLTARAPAGCTDYDWMVVTREGLPIGRLRYTIAHEIGHLYLHQNGLKAPDEERWCNAFAAELLMPRQEVRKLGQVDDLTLDRLDEFSRDWFVSRRAALLRLRHVLACPAAVIDFERSDGRWLITGMTGMPLVALFRLAPTRACARDLDAVWPQYRSTWLRFRFGASLLEVRAQVQGKGDRRAALVDGQGLGRYCAALESTTGANASG